MKASPLLSEAAAGERAIRWNSDRRRSTSRANELLGEVLLEHGRAKEACEAFEAAQVIAPGRGHRSWACRSARGSSGNTELADNADARLAKVRLREALAGVRSSRLLHNALHPRPRQRCAALTQSSASTAGLPVSERYVMPEAEQAEREFGVIRRWWQFSPASTSDPPATSP